MRFILYGRFSVVGFAFVKDGKMHVFGTTQGNRFRRLSLRMDLGAHFDFRVLPVTDEESDRLFETCDACTKAVKLFNLADLLLIHVPLREPAEIPLFETVTLNNAQAVILILRECLDPTSVLRGALDGLHSRLALAETVHDRVRPCTLPILYARLLELAEKGGKRR
jgi:hypothetical protein